MYMEAKYDITAVEDNDQFQHKACAKVGQSLPDQNVNIESVDVYDEGHQFAIEISVTVGVNDKTEAEVYEGILDEKFAKVRCVGVWLVLL